MKKLLILVIFNIFAMSVFAKNIVITSIQPLYSLVSILTDDTNIKSHVVFGSDVSMTMSKEAMKDEDFNLDIASSAQAVVDIASIWNEDVIYDKARLKNIHIIEIDASRNYDDTKSQLFFVDYKNGKVNPYVWLSYKNVLKMANIIARDLEKIYPSQKAKINENLIKFTSDFMKEIKKIHKEMLEVKTTEVISLSENIKYFLNDMDLYVIDLPYDSINANNVADIMEEQGIKTFVSDRWLKKDVVKAIKDAGGSFVFIDTLDVPYDDDDEMDDDAIIDVYEDNAENLIKALKK